MEIKITVFDKLVKQLTEKTITAEGNAAATHAGFAVETYLRRFDTKYITIKIGD